MSSWDSFLNQKDPLTERREKLLDQQFLTIKEVTSILDVSRWTVMRWVTEGTLSGQKVGRKKLIPSDQVKRLMNNKESQKSPGLGKFSAMSPAQVREVTKVLAEVLTDGYMPVSPDELIGIVLGRERAGPLFWSALVAGIETRRPYVGRLVPMR